MKSDERLEASFVIRIWCERHASPWRASITHVASRELRYFTNYGELCEFIDRWLRQPQLDE